MKKIFYALSFFVLITAFYGCQPSGNEMTFEDARDGNVYEYVQIGNQFWMAENLRFKSENGYNRTYMDEDANIDSMGYYYDWKTASTACPEGWHLPAKTEWDTLVKRQGGYKMAAIKLRSTTSRWGSEISEETNQSGFSAKPDGVLRHDNRFAYFNKYAYFWSSTENNDDNAWAVAMDGRQSMVHRIAYRKGNSVPVRCVKD